jgi:hypothetical protein
MKRSTRYVNLKLMTSYFVILLLFSIQSSIAQTYAVYQNTDGTDSNPLLANVGNASQSNHSTAPDNLAAEMRASGAEILFVGTAGEAHLNLAFAAQIPAGKTSYIRVDLPTYTGISVNLGNLVSILGLLENNTIRVEVPGGGIVKTTFARNEAGEYFLAVTPTNAYTNLNIILDYAGYLGLGLGSVRLNVYYAEYHDDYNCGDSKYTNLGESIALLSTNILSNAVSDPLNAIDDGVNSENTASTIGASLISVGLGQELSQTIFFGGAAVASDEARIVLSFPGSELTVDILNNVTIEAYNGNAQVGAIGNAGSLIGLDLLGLFSTNDKIPVYFKPNVVFDRIKITAKKPLALNALAGDVLVYDVKIVTSTPTISSELVYQFAGAIPNVTATSTGNNLFWQGPLPATTNLNLNSLPSAAAFPTAVNSNGDYVAVSVKTVGCQTSFSDSTKLRVIVLTDVSTELPKGISGVPYASGGSILATSAPYTFTYSASGLPATGISFNSATGALTASGSLPVVTEITNYSVVVTILSGGQPTGLTLTKQLTVYPPMEFDGGTFPAASDLSDSYSADLKGLFGPATGGTGGAYTYSLTNPGFPEARTAVAGTPTGFTLSTDGVLSGDPSGATPETYEFTIYASDGIQQKSADFSFTIVDGPLPVKLLSFKASKEGKSALLSWATTEETNSERFDLERSHNGKMWEVIGQQASSGESFSLKNYSLSDNRPLNGENFYRLKIVDIDGSFAYSQIARLNFEIKNNVYPNPVTSADNLLIDVDDWNKVGSITITDALGKTVYQSSRALPNGISMRDFLSGMYVVQVKLKNGTGASYKIVKR